MAVQMITSALTVDHRNSYALLYVDKIGPYFDSSVGNGLLCDLMTKPFLI